MGAPQKFNLDARNYKQKTFDFLYNNDFIILVLKFSEHFHL